MPQLTHNQDKGKFLEKIQEKPLHKYLTAKGNEYLFETNGEEDTTNSDILDEIISLFMVCKHDFEIIGYASADFDLETGEMWDYRIIEFNEPEREYETPYMGATL